ncbi:hypothetical protein K469DRAFT_769911 [Zopfia rhizophila CBS 207.26]|uniref:Heterokaryon incompatibility domain-containing protein n=1 Tax=Zopfia rhizophila CBS 207.26 TaxID=1314779 RepID=A0A6A6E9Z2_9PEZI|nr:hypothetical protein K469DRAFT_769911 [Zopfia rhizophila CBS 207.26]
MDRNFCGAYATIITFHSPNADSGIPGGAAMKRDMIQIFTSFGSVDMISDIPSLEDELGLDTENIWVSRVWAYQEGLLSHRRIVFTKHGTHFACNAMDCSESSPNIVTECWPLR